MRINTMLIIVSTMILGACSGNRAKDAAPANAGSDTKKSTTDAGTPAGGSQTPPPSGGGSNGGGQGQAQGGGASQQYALPANFVQFKKIEFYPARHSISVTNTRGQKVLEDRHVIRYYASAVALGILRESGVLQIIRPDATEIMSIPDADILEIAISASYIFYRQINGRGAIYDLSSPPKKLLDVQSTMTSVQISDSYFAYKDEVNREWRITGTDNKTLPADANVVSLRISDRFVGTVKGDGQGSIMELPSSKFLRQSAEMADVSLSNHLEAYLTQSGGVEILDEDGKAIFNSPSGGWAQVQVSNEFAGVLSDEREFRGEYRGRRGILFGREQKAGSNRFVPLELDGRDRELIFKEMRITDSFAVFRTVDDSLIIYNKQGRRLRRIDNVRDMRALNNSLSWEFNDGTTGELDVLVEETYTVIGDPCAPSIPTVPLRPFSVTPYRPNIPCITPSGPSIPQSGPCIPQNYPQQPPVIYYPQNPCPPAPCPQVPWFTPRPGVVAPCLPVYYRPVYYAPPCFNIAPPVNFVGYSPCYGQWGYSPGPNYGGGFNGGGGVRAGIGIDIRFGLNFGAWYRH